MPRRDPLGNPLLEAVEPGDCPYPCSMTLPHVHSLIFCSRCVFLVRAAPQCNYPCCPYQAPRVRGRA